MNEDSHRATSDAMVTGMAAAGRITAAVVTTLRIAGFRKPESNLLEPLRWGTRLGLSHLLAQGLTLYYEQEHHLSAHEKSAVETQLDRDIEELSTVINSMPDVLSDRSRLEFLLAYRRARLELDRGMEPSLVSLAA